MSRAKIVVSPVVPLTDTKKKRKRRSKPVFETCWRAKWTCDGASTLAEMAQMLRDAAATLDEMAADGLVLEDNVADDYAWPTTTDPTVAKKWGMYKRSQ